MSRRWFSLVVLTCWIASRAAADVLVVPVVEAGALDAVTRGCAATLEGVLKSKGERERLVVLTEEQLAAAHSRALVRAAPAQLAAFRSAADRAHEGLDARADFRSVLTHMAEVQERVDAAPEAFNTVSRRRETKSACLGAVSTLIGREQRGVAIELAEWCLASLDLGLHEHFAPPELMSTFRAADRALSERAGGELAIEVTPDAGCSTFLDGVALDAPASGGRGAALSKPYGVHASCPDGRTSRVHMVTPRRGETTPVAIDLTFDAAVRTDARGRVLLAYEGPMPADVDRHLHELAHAARASETIAVVLRRETVILRLAGSDGRSVSFAAPCVATAVDGALARLRAPAPGAP